MNSVAKHQMEIREFAKEVLRCCEEKGYTNSDVGMLIHAMTAFKDETVCKSRFETHGFKDSFYSVLDEG